MDIKEINVLYDRYGKPIFRLLNNGRVVSFNGKSYGFLEEDTFYNYKWKHVWWFRWGLVRDLSWNVVGFWEYVTDPYSPFLPFKQFKPFPGFVEFEPFRPFKEFKQFKPFKSFLRSNIDLSLLFNK